MVKPASADNGVGEAINVLNGKETEDHIVELRSDLTAPFSLRVGECCS